MKIIITRAIFVSGQALEKGETHDLAEDVASEIIRQGAAALAPEPESTPKKKQ